MTPLSRYVVETLVTLLAIVALSVVVLSALRRVGVGKAGGPLELVARLPLDGRRAVYLVRVGEKVYVLGASEHALAKLDELPPEALAAAMAAPKPERFAAVLKRALGLRAAEAGAEAAPSEPAVGSEQPPKEAT